MRLSKNVQGKKYIYLFFIISVMFCLGLCVLMVKQNKKETEIINARIGEILGEVEKQYPQIDDEQIIRILNKEESFESGKDILDKYGINQDEMYITELKNKQERSFVINILVICVSYFLLILVFIIYLKFRQIKIDKLDRYIQKVAKKDYSLNIEDYSEDELNCLKDSLYKITVMLKEESENKAKQNESILTSVSDISHQLKTPLTSVLILLDNITENPDMDEKTKRKFLMEITRQIKGMNFLILALLKLSRLEAGAVEFESKKINLKDLIEDVLSDLDILIDVKEIEIVRNIKANPSVIGDYNWNKEAILNIIKNAIEHTKQGKRVTIFLNENDVYSNIQVRDEGEGIDKEDLKHIFDRFYKTKNSKENSIGIGLALSKSIIEKQNGYIQVESELNNGTTFIIKYLK